MRARSRYTVAPTQAAINTPISRPAQPIRLASSASPAPIRCATSTPEALAMASGSMNIIDTMLTAIWWPATGVAPMREMKKAMKVKPVTSIRIDRPIGTPRRRIAARLARFGRHQPRASPKRA